MKAKEENMEMTVENIETEKQDKQKNGNSWIRFAGFLFLTMIGVIIFTLFKFPEFLNGPLGIIIPVSLFVLLFAAFYSLIISMKL